VTGLTVERPKLLGSNPGSLESFLLQNAKTSVRPKSSSIPYVKASICQSVKGLLEGNVDLSLPSRVDVKNE
jgi:hypothetical protein